MAEEWVALDFETANGDNGSVCRVGMVKVAGGAVTDRLLDYVQPPEPVSWFDPELAPFNGGVTAEDVRDAAQWPEMLKRITAFAGGAPVVAHFAPMEMEVVQRACMHSGVPVPEMEIGCSVVLARSVWTDSPDHKLKTLCARIGFDLDHHNPLSDAEGSARIVLELMRERGTPTLGGLCEREDVVLGRIGPDRAPAYCRKRRAPSPRFSRWNEESRAEPPAPDLDNADPDGPLYGATVCLSDTSRDKIELWGEIAAVGGTIAKNVTKKVTVLVVGDHSAVTAKRRKAEEYQAKGQPIAIIDEAELEQILREGA
ncbi:exonuclease domain-containing protein [Nocardiopsis composta]|uniref:DNA polymerase-3 subunit epsilon n=1 Tax=Nocardiopsis composta TaxID=157465 RepID=A0A7W8QMC0_9ACTN|nr:exonuclease domain-containing protein [Nocardiopsis composta]MBB5432438.1 DNA polymerase-3 subunit epsilon [Nocardiopsis composta]